MPAPISAAALLREVGLLADGPLPWGRPVPERGPGVFVVELPAPLATAPIELTVVGKWLEHVPTLRLDGGRPSSRALRTRLAAFWLPGQVVLYVGASETSVGARIAAMERTSLGDRRPTSAGHWLKSLSVLSTTRVWWAATDAIEEYEDALLATFADAVDPAEVAATPDTALTLPFANLRRPTGERRASGITGSLLAETPLPTAPPTRVVVLEDGDAEGSGGETPPAQPRRRSPPPPPTPVAPSRPVATRTSGPVTLTAEGAERLRAELDELVTVQRPQVVARIRAAKELGDLKENADYTAAREEQSFLEGRIQALEARLRTAVIAVAPAAGEGAHIGSVVTIEEDGLETGYTLVGSAEADLAAGRLSVASPVGRALLGAVAGDVVTVETPRGSVVYRVVAVG